jgi:hypothetical protein
VVLLRRAFDRQNVFVMSLLIEKEATLFRVSISIVVKLITVGQLKE